MSDLLCVLLLPFLLLYGIAYTCVYIGIYVGIPLVALLFLYRGIPMVIAGFWDWIKTDFE